MTLADKIANYITIRDYKKKADDQFKKAMEKPNAALAKLEAEILGELDAAGIQSSNAKGVGTAYVRVATSMTTESRDDLLKWAVKNRELDALDIRPNKTIIQEKLAKGEVVPGVKITQTRLIGVRKGN
jgi:hypothetical protein